MLNIFGLLVMSGKDEDMMAMLWAQEIMSAETVEEAHFLRAA